MTHTIDLFWSFRSPYAYLAVPGAQQLERDFNVQICFRPVLPLAVRDPAFFSPDNLKRARYIGLDWVRRAGPDLLAMEAAIATPASHQAGVEANQAALAAAGHWGVPTFVFNGEPFFGEDRIDTLRWRLNASGSRRPASAVQKPTG